MSLGSSLPAIGGALYGDSQAGDDDERSKQAMLAALAEIQGVHVPTIEEQQIALNQYNNIGDYTADLEGVENLGDSQMAGVETDPRLKDAQMTALAKMQALGNTGESADDRMVLNKFNNAANVQDQGRREQILQNMNQRGMGGAGAELAAQLASSQAAMVNQQDAANQQAASASQRAMAALAQSGQMGGQIRSQDFNEQSQKAAAADEIAKFNAANRQAVAQRNAAATNSGSQFNLGKNQALSNKNVDTGNQQEIANKGLYQQQYQNAMGKAGAVAGQQIGQAGMYAKSAQRTRDKWSGIGQGVSEGMAQDEQSAQQMGSSMMSSGGAAAMMSDERAKKDISSGTSDIEKFLDSLKPKNFEYKDPADGQGEFTGVMAQDVEKSPLGKEVVQDTEDGKMLDMKKSLAAMLAATGNLHERLKKMEGK